MGSRIYYTTVFKISDFEIKKAPRNPDEPPDPGDDDNPPVQYYWFRKGRRRWIKVSIRVLALIISVIASSISIAYNIIHAIIDEHARDSSSKDSSSDTTPSVDEKPTKRARPSRTKRHYIPDQEDSRAPGSQQPKKAGLKKTS
jgi:hypothetical protein